MASKRNPNILYVQEPRESLSSLETDHLAQPEPGEESSDSDGEPDETEQKLTRKVSTSGQLRAKVLSAHCCCCPLLEKRSE
uniref:Uncharacterized protein n=1 Tax=Hucho hucho TaxID=62062 RepID=A0A4W5K257_9TELE